MLLIVIFSYNRAMQLDFLLKSIIGRVKFPDYKISVIYHTSGAHRDGYLKIKNKYKHLTNISFLERKNQIFNIKSYFKTFYSLKNLKLFLRHSYLLNKSSDNFKSLLENLLKNTDCEFVMFNTDDGCFFDDVVIPKEIFNLISSKPLQTSYRLYVGENLDGFPDYIKHKRSYNIWNYYESDSYNHWTYPFSVDGTIYHTKCILGILRNVPYHNPVTLEGYVVGYVKDKKVLETGLGPKTSTLVCTKLNRVSTCTLNPTINISTEFLNSKYLEGYELEIDIPTKITNANIVPENIFLVKQNQRLAVYTLDQYGKTVQDALGPEGSKFEVPADQSNNSSIIYK
jgi:hypothetical protein